MCGRFGRLLLLGFLGVDRRMRLSYIAFTDTFREIQGFIVCFGSFSISWLVPSASAWPATARTRRRVSEGHNNRCLIAKVHTCRRMRMNP